MKPILCCFIILCCGCATQKPYFRSANDIYKEKVVLHLRNKPDQAGILSIPFEKNFNYDIPNISSLKFIPEGQTTEVDIKTGDIIGYSFGNSYYALKRLDVTLNNVPHLLFAKRLSAEDSRIQLYELYESGVGNDDGKPAYSYFISMPNFNQYETINTHSNKLIPEFELKMSILVSDCPTLSKKILEKQNGYFIPFVSFNSSKHKEVFTKIIDDYNNCK